MTNRIAYIDRIKGFTILLVVLGHLYLFGVHIEDCIPNKFIGACHMHLFMFLSGFVAYIRQDVIQGNNKSLEKKIGKRILSYIVPCFSIAWIVGLYVYFASDQPNDYLLQQSIFGGYWYLKSLTLYSILLYIITKANRLWASIAILIFSYLLFYIGWRISPMMNQILCLEHAVCFSPFFFMGYFFRKYDIMPKVQKCNWLFTLSLTGFIVLFFAELPLHALQVVSRQFIRPTFAVLFISYLFGRRADESSFAERWLEWLGTKTLDIYLFHGLFLTGVGFGVLNIEDFGRWVQDTHNSLLCLIALIFLSILLSYISIGIGTVLKCSKFFRIIIYGNKSV